MPRTNPERRALARPLKRFRYRGWALAGAFALASTTAVPLFAAPITAQAASPATPVVETHDGNDAFYCQERKLGTWFYCARPKPAAKSEPAEPASPAPSPAATATVRLEAVTAELRELKARAILDPSEANVTAYIRFQREQLDRASLFSDVWQRAVWQDPALDYTLERPVGTLAKRAWQDARSTSRDSVMAHLSDRYGLFYFFASTCGACEVMSPIIRSVAQTWHIELRAISTDGGPSRHFDRYTVETNQRAAMGLQPKVTPAVVLWDAAKSRAIPIGYGVMTADDLQDRIYLLTTKDPGRDF